MRGFWDFEKDFFTMHPYYRPSYTCETELSSHGEVIPFPAYSYLKIQTATFQPGYLELLPYFAEGLQKLLSQSHEYARVVVTCEPIHPSVASNESIHILVE